jgi:hypothetical protein
VLRVWLVRLLPFASRWTEAAPAGCCGMCGPCLTAAATGLSLEVAAARSERTEVGPPLSS